MLSQQEICFITYQVGMTFYMFPDRMNSSLNGNFLSVSFSREIPFPVHFQQSVIMVIARLFTGLTFLQYRKQSKSNNLLTQEPILPTMIE